MLMTSSRSVNYLLVARSQLMNGSFNSQGGGGVLDLSIFMFHIIPFMLLSAVISLVACHAAGI